MTLANFSRMCEAIENKTPTESQKIISESLSSFSDIQTVVRILCEEYEPNNIGSKKARKWIAIGLGIFDSEVTAAEYEWLDLAEGIRQFVGDDQENADISIREFLRLLIMDCSSIEGTGFILFQENIRRMSGLQLKWFLRYWLRTPRNGISHSNMTKALQRYYSDNDVSEYVKYHKHSIVSKYLNDGQKPPCIVQHGGFIPCMLAKKYNMANALPINYVLDIKYDGNRYQIHRNNNSVIIFNRKGNVVTNQFPDIVETVLSFDAHSFVIDTEIYPVTAEGTPAQHKFLAKRVHSKDKQRAVEECPVKLVIFDVMYYLDYSMLQETYESRLVHLKDFPRDYRSLMFEKDTTLSSAYNISTNDGFEGVMIKDLDATYAVGKRSKALLKHKPPRIELDVVTTSAKYGEGKRSDVFGTYGISVKGDSGYVSVGSVGTGFSDADLLMLTTELKKTIDVFDNGTFYLLPRIVLEVTGDMITQDSSGSWALRFPRVKRIRRDKFAADCNTLQDVIDMA